MKLGKVVRWEEQVLPSWRGAAHNSRDANFDVWSRLPQGVCWINGELEQADVAQLFVVGSQDWCDVFGSYRLQDIGARYQHDMAQAAQRGDSGDDAYHHHIRIQDLCASIAQDASHVPPLVLVAEDVAGAKVLLDGNHRALALLQLHRLVGQSCFLGLHADMARDFLWMRRALQPNC